MVNKCYILLFCFLGAGSSILTASEGVSKCSAQYTGCVWHFNACVKDKYEYYEKMHPSQFSGIPRDAYYTEYHRQMGFRTQTHGRAHVLALNRMAAEECRNSFHECIRQEGC